MPFLKKKLFNINLNYTIDNIKNNNNIINNNSSSNINKNIDNKKKMLTSTNKYCPFQNKIKKIEEKKKEKKLQKKQQSTIISTTTTTTTTSTITTTITEQPITPVQQQIDWNIYTKQMENEGFTKSCIVNLNSGDSESGSFTLGYNEYVDITNTLGGENPIGLFVDRERYFISNSNDSFIEGKSSSYNSFSSFVLRKTNNKGIIGIFEMEKISIDKAHEIINGIYKSIIEIDKNEAVPNLICNF